MKTILKTTIFAAILAGFIAQPLDAMETVQKTPTWKRAAYVVGGVAVVGAFGYWIYSNYYAEQPQENTLVEQSKKDPVLEIEEQLPLVTQQEMKKEIQEKGWLHASVETVSQVLLYQIDITTLQIDFAFPQDTKNCYELLKSWNEKLQAASEGVNGKKSVTEEQLKLWQDTMSVVACLEKKLESAELLDEVLTYNNGELQKLYYKPIEPKSLPKTTSEKVIEVVPTVQPKRGLKFVVNMLMEDFKKKLSPKPKPERKSIVLQETKIEPDTTQFSSSAIRLLFETQSLQDLQKNYGLTIEKAAGALEQCLQDTKNSTLSMERVDICLERLQENQQFITDVLKYDNKKLKKYAHNCVALKKAYTTYKL